MSTQNWNDFALPQKRVFYFCFVKRSPVTSGNPKPVLIPTDILYLGHLTYPTKGEESGDDNTRFLLNSFAMRPEILYLMVEDTVTCFFVPNWYLFSFKDSHIRKSAVGTFSSDNARVHSRSSEISGSRRHIQWFQDLVVPSSQKKLSHIYIYMYIYIWCMVEPCKTMYW